MAQLHDVYLREDGLWQIGMADDAPGPFSSRADAERIACRAEPAAVASSVRFRRFKGVSNASA